MTDKLSNIETRLRKLKGKTLLHHVIKSAMKDSTICAINFIYSQGVDNPKMMSSVIGKETWELIQNFKKK